jgi:hypothetical protein
MIPNATRLGACTLLWTAALLFLVATSADLVGQPAKGQAAKVVVSGKETGIVTIDDSVTKQRYVLLEVDDKTTIKVSAKEDVTKFNKELLAEHDKMTKAFLERVKLLIQQNDFKAVKEAEQEFKAASDEMLKHLSYCTAEGTVVQTKGEVVLQGKMRLYAYKGVDKDLGKGRALVEGEAMQVKYDAGKGEKNTLAIRNTNHPIVVVGKLAEENAAAKGMIRVHGVLRSSGKDGKYPILEADRIEVLQK